MQSEWADVLAEGDKQSVVDGAMAFCSDFQCGLEETAARFNVHRALQKGMQVSVQRQGSGKWCGGERRPSPVLSRSRFTPCCPRPAFHNICIRSLLSSTGRAADS
jgi:hypothetical protein